MKENNKEIEKYRLISLEKRIYGCNGDSKNGCFEIKIDGSKYFVIASNGCGWEHVSVSNKKHIPSWKVMSKIKDLFFEESETVIQFHPKKSEYVNNSNNCLHLWKPINNEIELPPTILTGVKENGKQKN